MFWVSNALHTIGFMCRPRKRRNPMGIQIYTDGACRKGNPGQTSCAFVAYNGTAEVFRQGIYLGPELHTNNYAEFQGLIFALKWASILGITRIMLFCDSKLVVNTVNETWELKEESLKTIQIYARALMIRGNHTLHHIKGHSGILGNEVADLICNEILDKEEQNGKE
jgi:ribonuclease HI